ncbi:putative non-lysosomal glucosylceramidase-like [Apostichopus japonicus]|uniref:Putative non-lysosomal glucosylceramidase-like n=1 Tax=Stichopus japonicus TaxID=307972 RepID=A0A2G8LLT5_STIJA|nr:putative non-lysosomal glucosylceramidase-like [Apostichopus japonicus]
MKEREVAELKKSVNAQSFKLRKPEVLFYSYHNNDDDRVYVVESSFLVSSLSNRKRDECKDRQSRLTAAAVCTSCTVEPAGKKTSEFVVVWDMPQINFKLNGFKYNRRYTKFFGSSCQATADLSLYALENHQDWEQKIDKWQLPVLEDKSLPHWYKSALFNELYFISDGGTVWVESVEEFPHGVRHKHTWSHELVREYGRFGYLEGHEYRMYNTYDVHFYASFALAMLWPKLELGVQYDFGNLVEHEDQEMFSDLSEGNRAQRKYIGSIPHDIGDPEEEPWVKVNSYLLHDTTHWRDLNSKFVLMVFRDYQFTKDLQFLTHMWPKCKIVMESAKEHDTDGDGVIDNCGKADQTYDVWVVTGASAYCGGLWLAALRCMCEMARILDHQDALQDYQSILDRGKVSYDKKLWNGRYYNYDSSDKVYSDSIMADQTAGHWYLRACDLVVPNSDTENVFPVSNVQSALRTIYEMNVLSMKDGTFGAINGMRPNGKVDSTSLQGEEIWTGVTYALAANMIQEGMLDEGFQTASGIYHTCFNRAGLAYQTPEGFMKRKVYRSLGYMRPLSIWAMQYAFETQAKEKKSSE